MLFVLTLAVAGFSGGESKERAGDTGSPALEPPAVVEISEQTREFNSCSQVGDLNPYGEVEFTIGLTTKGEEVSLAYWLLDSDGHVLRWATTWASAWPLKNVDAIVKLQADDANHWASMFRPLHGRSGLHTYLEECFSKESQPAQTWFSEPVVDGDSACVEYWVILRAKDQPTTISGCTVLYFDPTGFVREAPDYSHAHNGHHERPRQAFDH